jgi:pilus assembly protein CpaB
MKRPAVFFACAVLLGIVTLWMVHSYTQSLSQTAQVEQKPTATVICASDNIPIGSKLEEKHLRAITWPADSRPRGSFANAEELLGKVTIASMVADEPFVPAKLVGGTQSALLPQMIPPGMRAMSVPVTKVSGISGFVTPGTKVDIVAVVQTRGEVVTKRAFTLLEDVKVLAMNQTLDERDAKPTVVDTVTVLVTPADAQRLTLAAAEGQLMLSLRGVADTEPANAPGVTALELAGEVEADAPQQVAEAKRESVELIRGPDRVTEKF